MKALLSRNTAKLTEPLSALLDEPHPDLLSLLAAAISTLFGLLDQNERSLWCEVWSVSIRQPGEFLPLYEDYDQDAQRLIRGAVVDAKRRGDLVETLDVELLAQTVYSIVDYAGLVFINGFSERDSDEFLIDLVDDENAETLSIAGIDIEAAVLVSMPHSKPSRAGLGQ